MKIFNKISIFHKEKGQVSDFVKVLLVMVAVVLVLMIVPYFQLNSVVTATSYLTDRGYVVLAASEYSTINAKLDALKVSADAATVAAQLAVVNAQLAVTAAENAVTAAETAADKVDLFNSAETFMFPESTASYVLFASSANNTFGAWAEIKDNNLVTLSSKFALNAGYIADVYLYDLTIADTLWMIVVSYGVAKTTLFRMMFNSEYMDLAQIKSRRIPAGETIYYRMMANAAPTEYVSVGFRYFYE